MFKNVSGKLGRVMIRMGTNLLLLSHKNLASLQQDFILKETKKDLKKLRRPMEDPWRANCDV
jgi:hypothetical protein